MAGYEPPAEASLGSRGKRSRTFRVAKIFMAPKGKSRPGRDPGISIPSPGAPGAAQLRHLGAGDVGCDPRPQLRQEASPVCPLPGVYGADPDRRQGPGERRPGLRAGCG